MTKFEKKFTGSFIIELLYQHITTLKNVGFQTLKIGLVTQQKVGFQTLKIGLV